MVSGLNASHHEEGYLHFIYILIATQHKSFTKKTGMSFDLLGALLKMEIKHF